MPTRREFLRTGAAITGVTVAGVTLNGCFQNLGTSRVPTPPPGSYRLRGSELVIDLDATPVLAGPGGAVKYALTVEGREAPQKVVVAHAPDGYVALEDRCTHAGGELGYRPDEGRFRCASFSHSRFRTDGTVAKGPADEPVPAYRVTLAGPELVVHLG